ncbi:hypothetical protein [Anthocerotibacter panamensis]|uniref:hypothetical protein n=1 Tax=Anthocerotibacter panamensis TaxID=2857077 RepID=UPI001C404A05|nr:hypothetical protein [Anthocerotibacter panamensis]
MEIDIEAVRDVFRNVLAGRMTREAADRWAYALVQQSETDSLIFVPESEKKRIWDGIMYLYGVDLMEEPEEYLHTDEDIRLAMQAKVGEG